jgi:hypothetical protein
MDEKVVRFTKALSDRDISMQLASEVSSAVKKEFKKAKIVDLRYPKDNESSFFGCSFIPNENKKAKEGKVDIIINSDHTSHKRIMRLMMIDPLVGPVMESSDIDVPDKEDKYVLKMEIMDIETKLRKDLHKLKELHDRAA